MRHAVRERYRVYSADEFLADPLVGPRDEPVATCARPAPRVCGGRRRRLAGAAALVGAIGSVGAVTAASLLTAQRQTRARRVHVRRTPSPATATATATATVTGTVARPSVAARSRLAAAARARRAPSGSRPSRAHRSRRAGERVVAIAAGERPPTGREAVAYSPAAASAPAVPRPALASTSGRVESARGAGEFGFER